MARAAKATMGGEAESVRPAGMYECMHGSSLAWRVTLRFPRMGHMSLALSGGMVVAELRPASLRRNVSACTKAAESLPLTGALWEVLRAIRKEAVAHLAACAIRSARRGGPTSAALCADFAMVTCGARRLAKSTAVAFPCGASATCDYTG